ncbi:Alpha/Beta hydrolase protein [Cladochytrium replicatum]|nr:Alpha/Beta hydrolase protein [Cladochytrium replicatum]
MDAREVDVEDTASILLQPTVHALPSPSVSAKAVMTSAAALAASVFNENDCDLGTKDLVGQNQRTNGFSNRSWDALRTPVRIKVSSLPKRKNEPPNARPETAKPPLESAKPRTTCWLSPKQSSKPSSGTDPTAESDPTFQKRSETSGPTSNNYGGPSESSRKLSDSAISPGNSPSEPERNHPELVQIQLSHCGNFNVVAESYSVPLMDGSGACLPMSRKCSTHVYAHPSHAKGIVLLVPGYANNRHMFDVGGGRGKSGISFMEFLVSRGYDTFAVDLRGTAESKRMGCVGASGLVEHVEVDIPSAIRMVKSIGRCEKVYLIGHSMGGALSCAVAGVLPNDIAGIVHAFTMVASQ